MERTYKRTNIYVLDEKLWAWAKYRAESLGFKSVSEYIFKLIELDREKEILHERSRGLEK